MSTDTPTRLRLTTEQVAFRRKWAKELRSGAWKQGVGRYECDGHRCCLGVACELGGVALNHSRATHPPIEEALLTSLIGTWDWGEYVNWNDLDKLTFPQIADRIDAETDAAEVIG